MVDGFGTNMNNGDPFGSDPFTPNFGGFQTKGTLKYLAAIFVVDCSRTMENGRIGAVNSALKELKYKLTEIKSDNNLDLKVAIMSFTSSAKWEVGLTPIEELNFENMKTRAGLTQYGVAFHELNKVLTKENFMKHTGKIAPPAIMFLTDGEPDDDYSYDLDILLKNGWFANASRSAVLIGDAIYNDKAKAAVSKFVNDPDNDIVTAEDSTLIIQKVQLATMHTIAGDPISGGSEPNNIQTTPGGNVSPADPFPGGDPFPADPFPGGDPFPADPFPGGDPFPADPFPGGDPFPVDDSFATSNSSGDPFGGNPFDTN